MKRSKSSSSSPVRRSRSTTEATAEVARPPRRALAWDLHLLAHALAQPLDGADMLQQLCREWLQRPRARPRLGHALLLAARDRYAARR